MKRKEKVQKEFKDK